MNALEQLKKLAVAVDKLGEHISAFEMRCYEESAGHYLTTHGHAIVELIGAAKTATFHLRRGDHVGDAGHSCTSSMIESLDAALRKLTEDKP